MSSTTVTARDVHSLVTAIDKVFADAFVVIVPTADATILWMPDRHTPTAGEVLAYFAMHPGALPPGVRLDRVAPERLAVTVAER